MNTTEFDREFDNLYDNLASKGAPGVNKYEKSLQLTIAQEQLIKAYYSGYNDTRESFESSEKNRVRLKNLLIPYSSNFIIPSSMGISNDSKFFKIPDDSWYIVYERADVTDDTCNPLKQVKVKPVTHDEYNKSIENPFRKPNKRKIMRLDIGKIQNQNVVELISPFIITNYYMRYIKKPLPIILVDFESDSELQGLSLTIDGLNTKTECQLSSEVHREIIERAVENTIMVYRENNLQNQVQLNKRSV